MKKINLHAHSMWSDGSGTIEEMTAEYERLGFVVSIITDHDYMIKDKTVLESQREEIRILSESGKFSIPIIQGCEITLPYGEEAVLFGEQAIDYWFSLNPERAYQPGMFDNFDHAVIWAHPRIDSDSTLFEDLEFLSTFHGFEIENSGNPVFLEEENEMHKYKLNKIKQSIKYEPYKNSDAHSVRMIKLSYNITDRQICDERDLITWIKSRKID